MGTLLASTPAADAPPPRRRRDRTHWLYLAVIAAVVGGVALGLLAPGTGKQVGVLGSMFVDLIKMMITPVIFCTIVLGIGSVRKAATVGKVGGLAFAYFLVMSTVALAIGLVVGNLLSPGSGLHMTASAARKGTELAGKAGESGGIVEFIHHIIPTSLLSALTDGNVLQALFVALLVGFALQAMGDSAQPILRGVEYLQKLVFKVLGMILWLAPIGAFGAIANVVGQTGWHAVTELLMLMVGFYLTCLVFVFGVLGVVLRTGSGVSIFRLVRYLAREYLLIFATSSSESALPRLIAKMEHLGVDRSTVGVVVPTGYSFNLDGTAIYLTMASLFVADAMGHPLSIGHQLSLLVFMIIASKGAAGVSGAGLATLAGGLQSHRPDLVDGVGLIVGIDRFMSEARAVTNFSGNAVATLLVGSWTKTVDRAKVSAVLRGDDPFDEVNMVDDGHGIQPAVPAAKSVAALGGSAGTRPTRHCAPERSTSGAQPCGSGESGKWPVSPCDSHSFTSRTLRSHRRIRSLGQATGLRAGVSTGSWGSWFAHAGGVRPRFAADRPRRRARLTFEEREEIALGIKVQESIRSIGAPTGSVALDDPARDRPRRRRPLAGRSRAHHLSLIAQIERDNVRALFGEPNGMRPALTRCGTSDECNLAVKLHGHDSSEHATPDGENGLTRVF